MFPSGEAVPLRLSPDLDENYWNFVTGLDAGLQSTVPLDLPELSCISSADIQQAEQNQEAPALFPNITQQLTAVERRQEKNRLAQKRFRQRKKERSSTTEAQLAETTSQLHSLKLKQKELEARNALLEKLARLDKQHKLQQESPTNGCNVLMWQDDAEAVLSSIKEVMEGSAVVLTVQGYKQLMALEDFASWTAVQFGKLYTAYTHKQAQHLVEIEDDPGSPALASLQRLSLEISAVFTCLSITNPRVMDILSVSSMDAELQSEPHPDTFYNDLLATMNFTPSQAKDLLQLRRLLYGRTGQLLRERQALLNRMSVAEQKAQLIMSQPVKLGYCRASDALGEMTKIAEQLHSNAMDDRKSYKTFSSAFFRGIQTSKQTAVSMVHPYPFLMDATKQLEALARQYNEPPIQTLMEPGGVDDLQHAANWETVLKYVQTMEAGNLHCHHPFLQDHANQAADTVQPGC
ncbi:hypothetical protein WJX77_002725 [Trebouxia sp. C0004]